MDLIDNWNKAAQQTGDRSDELVSLGILSLNPKEIERMDDPIVPYLNCVEYLRSHSSPQDQLIEALQKCTHDFKDDEIYKDDVRYLDIWLQYIQFSDSQFDIFLYLFKKSIGSRLGLFYQKFSDHLEKMGDYQKCLEVYQYAVAQKNIRNWVSLEENFTEFSRRLVNYEKFSGSVDRNAASFLTRVQKRKHSLDTEESQRKRSKLQSSELYGETYHIVKVEGKADEKWKLNLSLLYSEDDEYTPEEIMCMERGIYEMKYVSSETKKPSSHVGLRLIDEPARTKTTMIPLRDTTESERNIIHTSLSPTMITKETNKEIMDIFNLPILQMKESATKEPLKQSEDTVKEKHFEVKVDEEVKLSPQTPEREELSQFDNMRGSKLVPLMTPILELTEYSTSVSEPMSSPFVEQPLARPITIDVQFPSVVDPWDLGIKSKFLQMMEPKLFSYSDYYVYNTASDKLSSLKQLFATENKKGILGNKNSMVEFDNELYCVRNEFGDSLVFLAETSTGELEVIKIGKPLQPYEFCILKNIEQRVPNLTSIVKAKGLHLYRDESYLLLEYFNQGTLSELISQYHAKEESIDEQLIMLIMSELIDALMTLHESQFIHGNLSLDNCMVSISSTDILKIIDFQNAIDVSLLPSSTKFKIDNAREIFPQLKEVEISGYEIDYFGMAGILHMLLFQEPIVIDQSDDKFVIQKSMGGYWNENWAALFDTLLNSTKLGNAAAQKIKNLAKEFRSHLEGSKSHLQNLIDGKPNV